MKQVQSFGILIGISIIIGSIFVLNAQNFSVHHSESILVTHPTKTYTSKELGIFFSYPKNWTVKVLDKDGKLLAVEGLPGLANQKFQLTLERSRGKDDVKTQAQAVQKEFDDRISQLIGPLQVGSKKQYQAYTVTKIFGGDANFETTFINLPNGVLVLKRPMREENPNYPNEIADYDLSEVILQTLEELNIQYTDTVSNVSFVLPRNIKPVGDYVTAHKEFMQFTVPAYNKEGTEMIPFLQYSTSANTELFSDKQTTNLSLNEFVTANVVRVFGENPSITHVKVNNIEQIRICNLSGIRHCSALMLSKNGKNVIEFTLEYPHQGPRSVTRDTVIEKAYLEMINSVTFL